MRRGDEMRQPKNSNTKSVDRRRMRRQTKENAARRWDAPAEQRNGGAVMECAGQKREDDEFDSMEHHLRDEKEGSLETGKLEAGKL
jgi:hypothetical protein